MWQFRKAKPNSRASADPRQLDPVSTQNPVLLVTLFELEESVIEEAIRRFKDRHSAHHVLVFVTSAPSFKVFLRAEVPFEFLMGIDEAAQHSGILNWHDYTREKWELLLAKWRPRKIVSVGLSPERFINLHRKPVS